MPDVKELIGLISAWLVVTLAGGVVAGTLRFIIGPGASAFPPQRRRAVVWNSRDVAGLFLVLILAPGLVLSIFGRDALVAWFSGPSQDVELARKAATTIASLLASPLIVAVWCWVYRSAGYPLAVPGLTGRRVLADNRAAYQTWLAVTPVVYAVNYAVTIVYALCVPQPVEEHPIVQLLRHRPPSGFAALLAVQAILAAPVCEELFFRGALLPWLADQPWGGTLAMSLAAAVGVFLRPDSDLDWHYAMSIVSWLAPALFVLALVPLYVALDRWSGLARWLPVRDPDARRQAARAIFGSAALFANFHSAVWPTPIPLFVLALGLGWLAYRTQGVVAPIIVHMMFNAIVFGTLLLSG